MSEFYFLKNGCDADFHQKLKDFCEVGSVDEIYAFICGAAKNPDHMGSLWYGMVMVLTRSIIGVLVYKRDKFGIKLDIFSILKNLELNALIGMLSEDLSDDHVFAIRKYISELPGYQEGHSISIHVYEHHLFRVLYMIETLSLIQFRLSISQIKSGVTVG